MSYEPDPLCWCGHKRALHQHFRQWGHPVDCSECGITGDTACLMFTPYWRRKVPGTDRVVTSKPFNEAQRRAGEMSDRRLRDTLAALQPWLVSTRFPVPPLPIPAQRRPWRSVAEQAAQQMRRKRP